MSKMSQLHLTLDDQAVELGFEGLGEALMKGYEVDYENRRLVNPYVLDMDKGHEEAHKEWLEEKQQVLNDLDIVAHSDAVPFEHKEIVKRAIQFIRDREV